MSFQSSSDTKYYKFSIKTFSSIFTYWIRELVENFRSTLNSINFFRNEVITSENTFQYLKDHLTVSDFVLDVGTGTGLVADLIRKKIKCGIFVIDVFNLNRTKTPILTYDGKNIPFCNNTFSAVLCCFVLHHTEYQELVIKEMKRVTSSKIYIFEDIPITIVDKIMLKIHDLRSRVKYNSKKLQFRRIEEWKEIFKKYDLQIERIIVINKSRQWWNPVSRRLFILNKSSSD